MSYAAATTGGNIGSATVLPSYLAFDANSNLWISSGSNVSTATNVIEATGLSSASCTAFPCTTGAATFTNLVNPSSTAGVEPFGLAGSATAMWVANAVGNSISSISLSTSNPPAPTFSNYASATSVSTPRFVAIDGAGNVWATNRGSSTITELSGSGTVLSPVPAGTATAPIGFVHSGLTSPNGIGIDPSGNVWVANNTTNANANSIFEVVGAAAPAVTPIALALKNNAYGAKP